MKKFLIALLIVLLNTGISGAWFSTPPSGGGTGSGDVSQSGSPANHYWAYFTADKTITGVAVTASKPVCTDADGNPAVCAGTEGVWQVAGSYLTASSIAATITNGDTTHAPDGNSVYDALALKQDVGTYLTDLDGIISGIDGNNLTLKGALITTAADGSRKLAVLANTVGVDATSDSFEIYPDSDDLWKINQHGTEYTFVLNGLATGGLLFGDSSPDAAGEMGYASGKFLFFGANSEDFYIEVGSASDKVTLGSNTSVATVDFGALNLVTTGTINGKIKTVVNSDTASYNVTAAQMDGTFFITTNTATTTYNLPAAAAGYSACFKMGQGNAQVLRIDTDGTDYIVMSTGARTSSAGDYYGATSSASNQVCVVAFDSTDYYVTSEKGTWTEE